MKQDERKVYVLSGTLVPYTDGSGVSVTDSDNSIIVRDADTGGLEQVSPDAILSIDDVQDPYEQKELAAQSIREQFAREAADKIDGVVTFNPGETYTIAAEGGSQIQVTIVSDENGIIDNGDGTINVTDGTNVFPVAKRLSNSLWTHLTLHESQSLSNRELKKTLLCSRKSGKQADRNMQ